MINSTILSLSAIFLIGSPFSISPISKYKTLSIEKCLFKRSLHNLFYINIFQSKLNISATTFNEIIGGAIQVDSGYDYKDATFEMRINPHIMFSNDYTFTNCRFNNIYTVGETANGGAMCLLVPFYPHYTVRFSIISCSFCNCYAAGGQGGAVYCNRTFSVKIAGTSFSNCTTRESSKTGDFGVGTAVYVYDGIVASSSRSSFTECPATTVVNPNTESVFFAHTDSLAFDHSNFSRNAVEAGASSVCLIEQNFTHIANCVMENLTGETALLVAFQGDCALLRLVFANCRNSSEPGDVHGFISLFHASPAVEDSVFVMGDFTDLVSRQAGDKESTITFSRCTFDIGKDELEGAGLAAFAEDCTFGEVNPTFPDDPTTHDASTQHITTYYVLIGFSVVGCLMAVAIIALIVKSIVGKKNDEKFDKSATLNEEPLLK